MLLYLGNYMDDPFYTYDIRYENAWPQHIRDMIIGNDSGDKLLTMDEVAAVLFHVAMVETGFIPSYVHVDLERVMGMTARERILRWTNGSYII